MPNLQQSNLRKVVLGVIGGTGLYSLEGLTNVESIYQDTPFGWPSSPITSGYLGDTRFLFLARHGVGHIYSPSEINYRANIYALKKLGAQWVVSVSAVGSLKEEFAPGHLCIPDQLIDRTKSRENTFFSSGIVAHVPFASPFCPILSEALNKITTEVVNQHDSKVHTGGTYVCMEGPAFSTRAESQLYRSWGASLIGMTALPEAKLAREAELSYAMLALVSDYDCWRSADADIDIEDLLKTLANNTKLAKQVLVGLSKEIQGKKPPKKISNVLDTAIITARSSLSSETISRLDPILERYLSQTT